jgi:hypothetical protein
LQIVVFGSKAASRAGTQLKRHPFNLYVFSFHDLSKRELRQKAIRSQVIGVDSNL